MSAYLHTQTRRIVMSEVDVAQIHFTTFLRWMDRGLSEWLAEVGYPFTRLLADGPGIPIVDSQCSFLARVHLDDLITLQTGVKDIGRTSFRSGHRFFRGDELVGEGTLVHVCVDRVSRATLPVPEWLRTVAHASWPPPAP